MNVPEQNSQVWYASCNNSYINDMCALEHSANNRINIMINQVLDVNEALVAKILYDFDYQLQTRFKSSLFQFVLATDELSDGMFHETVRRIWNDAGPQGLRSYLSRELSLLEDYRAQKPAKLIS